MQTLVFPFSLSKALLHSGVTDTRFCSHWHTYAEHYFVTIWRHWTNTALFEYSGTFAEAKISAPSQTVKSFTSNLKLQLDFLHIANKKNLKVYKYNKVAPQ